MTDFEHTIISVLRPRTDENSDVKFTVREKYPLNLARQNEDLTIEKYINHKFRVLLNFKHTKYFRIRELINSAKENDDLKKVLTFNLSKI